MINGYRVRQAREVSCLTQVELAEQIGLAQSTIAHIESGRFQPSEDVVSALSIHLGFPVGFFSQEDPPQFPLGSLLFRAHSSLTAAQKAEAHRYGQILHEVSLRLGRLVKNKTPLRLPQLSDEPLKPASAAQLTRDALGLSPDMPIPHLVKAVEQVGVQVFALPTHLDGRDAYSLWSRFPTLWMTEITRPMIVLSSGVPGDRLRFSVAHEIGHLVMHQALQGTSSALEEEANRFAAELLMPETVMKERVQPPVTLVGLAAMKAQWGVSIQSLIRRAQELEIIKKDQGQYLFKRLHHYHWADHEPVDILPEKPRALRQMAEIAFGPDIEFSRLAEYLHLTPTFVRRIMQAHATREEYVMRTIVRKEDETNLLHLRTREG